VLRLPEKVIELSPYVHSPRMLVEPVQQRGPDGSRQPGRIADDARLRALPVEGHRLTVRRVRGRHFFRCGPQADLTTRTPSERLSTSV
jgi:hypothetical protein